MTEKHEQTDRDLSGERLRNVEGMVIRWDERFKFMESLSRRVTTLENAQTDILVAIGGMKVKWGVAGLMVSVVSSLITGCILLFFGRAFGK